MAIAIAWQIRSVIECQPRLVETFLSPCRRRRRTFLQRTTWRVNIHQAHRPTNFAS